ncbi:MAG: peptidylprolyl isomerase [Pseudomonadota bacterium]
MANKAAKKSSRAFVWAILGLLVLAMAGFGIGGFGGTVNSIGRVGKTEIGTDQYASTLQNLVQQQSQAFGQPLTIQQAFQIGLDARARQLVVEGAALTEETRVAGLSVGDAIVAREIQNNPAFQGASGFNRENYRLSLERSGLTQRGYEDRLREQLSRDLLQQAVVGGLNQEDGFADIMYDFIGEQRSFRWAPVPESLLVGATPAPTQAELEAFYDESGAQFTRPEIRNITYAWLSPEQMLDQIEVPEEDLQEAYESRINELVRPERRLIEQLSFPDTAAAADAKAQIEAGEATFEELVEARGLTLEDVDQGDVTLASLGGSVGETVFALEQPGIAGPVETSLGPAPASATSYRNLACQAAN